MDLISRKEVLELIGTGLISSRIGISEYQRINNLLEEIKKIPTVFDLESVIKQLQVELNLSDKEKERCARENPLQFDEAKGCSRGMSVALEILKSAANAARVKEEGGNNV